jgi:hypothetical protein
MIVKNASDRFVQILKDQEIDMNQISVPLQSSTGEERKPPPETHARKNPVSTPSSSLPKIYVRNVRFQNQNYKIPTIKLQPSPHLNYGNLYHAEVHPKNYIHSNLLALELEPENLSYLVYYYGVKYLLIKIDQEILLIQIQKNRTVESIHIQTQPSPPKSFKWTTNTYQAFQNGTLLIPIDQKKIYDNMYGTVHVVAQPSLFVGVS